jgi:hypothetical protein
MPRGEPAPVQLRPVTGMAKLLDVHRVTLHNALKKSSGVARSAVWRIRKLAALWFTFASFQVAEGVEINR